MPLEAIADAIRKASAEKLARRRESAQRI
jgi:hypothetical protein